MFTDPKLKLEIAYMLGGSMVVVSFGLLYQSRISAVINIFAVHATILGLAVAWQAQLQDTPNLYITAAIALVFKAGVIPLALHHVVRKMDIHRTIETVIGTGLTMLAGVGLVALAVMVMHPVTVRSGALVAADLIFALAVVLLAILMMITRRNAVTQVVGFMSLENGLILATAGVHGMPLVVEISVALTVLVAYVVFGLFLFRIRERFDSLDIHYLDTYRRVQR
ncbi:hydrogenase-4 component E [uncultured Gammaproteobacteria bacterium]